MKPPWKPALIGALPAGPVFWTVYSLVGGLVERATIDPHWTPPWADILSVYPAALVVGWLLAVPVVYAGTALLTRVGRGPLARATGWTLVGALLGILLALPFTGLGTAGLGGLAAMAATGATCARLARRYIPPLQEEGDHAKHGGGGSAHQAALNR